MMRAQSSCPPATTAARTGVQHVRQGPPALPVLLLHRVRQARLLGHHRPRRRRERHPRNLEVLPRAAGAALPLPRLLPPGELPGHRPPLRRDQRPGRNPGLPQAPLPPPGLPLLARGKLARYDQRLMASPETPCRRTQPAIRRDGAATGARKRPGRPKHSPPPTPGGLRAHLFR